jgi:hypothetical protein
MYVKLLMISGLLLCCISVDLLSKKNSYKKQMAKMIAMEAEAENMIEEKSSVENNAFNNAKKSLADVGRTLKDLDETLARKGYCKSFKLLPEIKRSIDAMAEKAQEVTKDLDAIKF